MRGDAKVPYPIGGGCQSITTGAASARTASGVGAQTRAVAIAASEDTHYRFGDSAVVATTADTFIRGGGEHHVRIHPGQYVAAIQNTTAGTLFVSELDG